MNYDVNELKAINAGTDGTITLDDRTVALTGSVSDITDAISGTFTLAHNGAIKITGSNPTVNELKVINNATEGTITLPDAGAGFSGSPSALADALSGGSVSGPITIRGNSLCLSIKYY